MSTSTEQAPRVWLAAGIGPERGEPADHPPVRDDQGRVWRHDAGDGRWHTTDGRHHQTWAQLHARSDLAAVRSS